ncbi:MAG: DNA polymerase [Acidobacteriota bacterium]
MRCIPAIAWMELTGAPIDAERWRVRAEGDASIAAQAAEKLNALAGRAINWRSPVQVIKVLQDRGHHLESTNEAYLQILAGKDELVKTLLHYREFTKRSDTYGLSWLKDFVNEETTRIHPNYKQLGAATLSRVGF